MEMTQEEIHKYFKENKPVRISCTKILDTSEPKYGINILFENGDVIEVDSEISYGLSFLTFELETKPQSN
jgi:hypothetical protein